MSSKKGFSIIDDVFFLPDKTRCSVCDKKYYPNYCKVCRRRDYSLCPNCHKFSKSHRLEVGKLHAK